MGQIQRLTRGRVKPYNSVPRIDWSHPLAAGLATYCYDIGGSIVDLVNSGHLTSVGVTGAQQSQFGIGTKFPLAGYGYMPPFPTNKIAPFGGTAPYSAVMGTLFTGFPGPATTGDGDMACVTVQSASNNLDTFFGFNTWPGTDPVPAHQNSISCVFANAANAFYDLPIILNRFQTWGMAASTSSAANLYADGVLAQTWASGTTFSGDTQAQVMYNTAQSNLQSFGNGIDGFIPYFAMWGRELSAAEALLLHQDPYCFLIYPEEDMALVGATGVGISGMGWFEPTDSIVALPRPSQSLAPAYVRPPTVFTPISGSAWNGQRDHAKLPPSVVYSEAPAFGRAIAAASTISGMAWYEPPDAVKAKPVRIDEPPVYVRPPVVFTPISGMAWQEPQLRDYPAKKAIVEELPAYVRPPTVFTPISGMAWFTPLDWATPKVSFSIPSAYAVNVAPTTNTNAGIPWFEPPDRDRPATKVSVEQPIAYVRPPTVFTPISGIAWHTPLDLITVKPSFSTPPAFGQFIFQPVPISGMAWFTPLDWSKSKVSFDQAPAYAVNVPAIPSTIAGMAWFEPPDRDRPPFRFTVEPQPSIALTPSTLPVSISGMAWFIPPGPLQRGVLGTDWAPYHVLKPTVQLVTVGTRRQTLFIANVGRFMNH